MMRSCPNFICLRFSAERCEQYPACSGCPSQFDCSLCSNQTEVVDGAIIPCDLRSLPEPCRICSKRNEDSFTQSVCDDCPTGRLKAAYFAHSRRLNQV